MAEFYVSTLKKIYSPRYEFIAHTLAPDGIIMGNTHKFNFDPPGWYFCYIPEITDIFMENLASSSFDSERYAVICYDIARKDKNRVYISYFFTKVPEVAKQV